MKAVEVAQNPAKQFEEAIWSRKQYLDTARGHYLSALAGLNGGKHEQTKISHSSDSSLLSEDYGFNQAAEAERVSTLEVQGQAETFSEMDVQMQFPNVVLKACEKDLESVKLQFDKTLARKTKSQLTEMFCRLGSFGKDMDINDSVVTKALRTIRSEPDDVKEPLPKTLVECSSLHQMVESLKAELEILKNEHAELKEIDAGAEFAAQYLHSKPLKSKPENRGGLMKKDKPKQISKEIFQDKDEINDLEIKGKGLKREHNATKASTKVEKKPRIVLDADEAREGALSTLNQAKGFSEGYYPAYVSTSESSARIMFSEDELESSSQQVGKSTKLERETLAEKTGVEDEKCVGTSEFSIRNFVFAARNKDIGLSWPFSQKNLQLCMKHGVKDVLPPFQPMDSLRESSMNRCLAEKSLHSEESTLDKKASMLKNHVSGTIQELDHSWDQELDHSWNQELAEGYRDSASLPIGGERDLAFKTVATANSHSEVESVSTSNLPLSEVSDEREAAASAANNKLKSSASQLSNTKCKVEEKMPVNSKRNTPEDITSACTAPSEAISSKICPVCENFSSSSNTTLNAHIDQCLSSQSPPIWMKSSKLNKPRIKPRKMRLMTDICATAPSCTLEDLDRRNGTHWAANVDSPLEDSDVPAERKNLRVSSRYINNVDDGSVYIDSSGRKIRILSKLNDAPSSISKSREDARPKKQSRNGKRSKFISPNRKKRLAKNLKYLKVTQQRKRFSSLKVKGRSTEACGAEEAVRAVGDQQLKQHQAVSFVKELKAQEQNRSGVAGTASQWMSSKISNLLQKDDSEDNTELSRYEIQAEKDPHIGYAQLGGAQVEPRGTPDKMHLNFPKRSLPVRSNSRTPVICPAEVDQRSGGSGREGGPLLRSAVRRNKKVHQVPMKLGARGISNDSREFTPKSSDSPTVPAPLPEREVDSQPNALQNADISFPCSKKLLCRYHVSPSEGMRSHNSMPNLFSLNLSCVQANSQKMGSSPETSCNCSGDKKAEVWSLDKGQTKSSKVTDFSRSSMFKERQKQALKHGQDVAIDTNRTDELSDNTRDNYGCVKSAMKGVQNNREFIAPVSSSRFAVGVNETSLSTALDPELEKVADVSRQFKRLKQSSLLRPEARGNSSEPGLNDDHEMFYGNVACVEKSELKAGEYILSFRHGSMFPEVDPIPIPGPPGSELPSFSDMGSDSSLAQLSRDGDDVVDGDLSESPLSATSTLSNLDRSRKGDFTVNKQESLSASLLLPDDVYPAWLGASSGLLPAVSTISTHFTTAAADIERATCVNNSEKDMINLGGGSATLIPDNQQCCCSQEEEITQSSIYLQESQCLGWRQTSSNSFSRGKHVYSTMDGQLNGFNDRSAVYPSSSYHTSLETTVEAAGPSSSTGDYGSGSPAPILRLMGKDLMISNRMGSDISSTQAAINVSMNKLVEKNWEPQSSGSPTFMGPLLGGHGPHLLPLQHCDVGSSNVMHSFGSHNQASGGVYNNEGMHASFSVLGTAHLQR